MQPERGFPAGFVSGQADRDALLVLAHCASTTPRELYALAWREGRARDVLTAARNGALGAGARGTATELRVSDARRRLHASGARMLDPTAFPERLLDLADPPAWLFVRGAIPEARSVAVIGARRCSAYGLEMASDIGRGLGAAGVSVVSGAAIGADGAAHGGAIEGGSPPVAVLGSGVDVAYPRRNAELIEAVAAKGAVVSEYPPGTPAGKWRFPARNRLVAALAEAVVVIEGERGSGSLITVDFAQDLGRPVLAVPGHVTSPYSEAPNELIFSGAQLVRGADDVLALLEITPALEGAGPAGLAAMEREVFEAVGGAPISIDALAEATSVLPGDLLAVLAGLELRGLVRAVGGRYERTARAMGR